MKTFLSVLVGVACGFAIQQLLQVNISPIFKICYGIIFTSTITRFFEGNIIFYSKTYYSNGEVNNNCNDRIIKGKFDFYFMLLQFFIFSAIGYYIGNIKYLVYSLLLLNISDFIWHGIAYLKAEKNVGTKKSSGSWCALNFLCALIPIGIFTIFFKSNTEYILSTYATETLYAFTLLYIGAALFDYIYNKDFYFGEDAKKVFLNF
jgi:hypothetical protein